MIEEPYIVASTKTFRPGCVIIQQIMGGDRELFDRHFGGADDWEVSDLDSMAAVPESRMDEFLALRARRSAIVP